MNGAGDAIAALFSAHYLREGKIDEALSRAGLGIFGVLAKTAEAGAPEIQLGGGAARDRRAERGLRSRSQFSRLLVCIRMHSTESRASAIGPIRRRLRSGDRQPMKRRFVTLDVFTDRRFAGNPLAVVLDAEGLDDRRHAGIAREFNLSETVFVLPPSDAAHRARLRIFTPGRELPFAGHPTVGHGGAAGACCDGGSARRDMVLEENIGPVPCRVTPTSEGGRRRLICRALPAQAGAPPPRMRWRLRLACARRHRLRRFRAGCWSAGNPFTFVPLHGLDAVGARQARSAAIGLRPSATGAPDALCLHHRDRRARS